MSVKDPTKFWGLQASKIDWFKPFDHVLQQDEVGYGKWFVGGQLNTCYNALDRHIARGHGKQTAIIYDSPVTNTIRHFSYEEVLEEVRAMAAYLRSLGVEKGDKVVIYLPNIPHAAFAMLACARIGAVHSVVFGGFAAHELAVRIKDCKPKAVISASCGIDGAKVVDYKSLLDAALDLVAPEHRVEKVVVLQRDQLICPLQKDRDISWADAMRAARALPAQQLHAPCTPVNSEDPLYVLYTSGTTGAPKGVQRDNSGHAVALAHSMDVVYGVRRGEVMWAASDVGWVVGHSYGTYGPLIAGATAVMYEGKPVGTPDAANFWRTLARHKVNVFFTAPTAIRAMKRLDASGALAKDFDLSALRTIHLAGEHADKDTLVWLEHATVTPAHRLGVPVRDHWWQTETGWPICADQLDAFAHKTHDAAHTLHGSTYQPCPGYDLQLFDLSAHGADDAASAAGDGAPLGRRVTTPHTQAQIFLKLPLPPGALSTLYNAPQRFRSSYLATLPGYYDTGDAGYVDERGNVFVMARTDDVLNVAGHRLGTREIEESISSHPNVAEVAVVGVADQLKGQVAVGFAVLKDPSLAATPEAALKLEGEIMKTVDSQLGAVARPARVRFVSLLPKTRSGKLLRRAIQAVCEGRDPGDLTTMDDPSALQQIVELVKT